MGLNSHTGLMRLGLKYAPRCTSSSCHRRALAACCAGVAPFRCDLHLCTLSSICRSGCLLSAPPKIPDGEAADGRVHGLTVRNDRELVRRRQLDPWQRAWPRVQAVARIFAPTVLRIPACRGRLTENVCAIPYSSIMQQITMPGSPASLRRDLHKAADGAKALTLGKCDFMRCLPAAKPSCYHSEAMEHKRREAVASRACRGWLREPRVRLLEIAANKSTTAGLSLSTLCFVLRREGVRTPRLCASRFVCVFDILRVAARTN